MSKYLKARIDGHEIFIKKTGELGVWLLDQKKNSKTKKTYEQILNDLHHVAECNRSDCLWSAYDMFNKTAIDLYPETKVLLEYFWPIFIKTIKKQEVSDELIETFIKIVKDKGQQPPSSSKKSTR